MRSALQWPRSDIAISFSSAFIVGCPNRASSRGSRSPLTIASMIRIPVLAVILLMTRCGFMLICVSAFCICWIW